MDIFRQFLDDFRDSFMDNFRDDFQDSFRDNFGLFHGPFQDNAVILFNKCATYGGGKTFQSCFFTSLIHILDFFKAEDLCLVAVELLALNKVKIFFNY